MERIDRSEAPIACWQFKLMYTAASINDDAQMCAGKAGTQCERQVQRPL